MKGIILLCGFIALVFGVEIYDGIAVKQVSRSIDLSTQLARYDVNATYANTGSKSASEIFLTSLLEAAPRLSWLEVQHDGKSLVVKPESSIEKQVDGKKKSFSLYRVVLAKALAPQESVQLRITAVFTHVLQPYPTKITQFEKQFVRFVGNAFYSTPYTVQTQTTVVRLFSSRVESKSEVPPTTVKGDTITYGPYADRAPFSYADLSVHFENNAPFLTVNTYQKDIEISHWGNVAVEETYSLEHSGAQLKGTFSRYDYQRGQAQAPSHIPVMRQILPYGASDIYYRDEIGNISTSHVSFSQRGITLDLIPRFPLFGGWKFGFYMGYNLPAQNYLFKDTQTSGLYMLNITFATDFDDAVIDDAAVRIIFPEGASNIEYHVPFDIDASSTDLHHTYLDTSGRPVLVLKKKNIVNEHNRFFQVTYNFSTTSMLREPFLLIIAFLLFFALIIVYVRFEFKIGSAKRRSEHADKIEDALGRLGDIVDQLTEQHQTLDKSYNDKNFAKVKADVDKKFNLLKSEITKIAIELDPLDASVANKVREVIKKEDVKIAEHSKLVNLEVQRAQKNVSKQAYEKDKAEFERSYFKAEDELDSLVNDLLERF